MKNIMIILGTLLTLHIWAQPFPRPLPPNSAAYLSSNAVVQSSVSLNTALVQPIVNNILNSNRTVKILYMGDSMTDGGDSGDVPNNDSTAYSMNTDLGLSYLQWPSFNRNNFIPLSAQDSKFGLTNWWVNSVYRLTSAANLQGGGYTNINVIQLAYFTSPQGGSFSINTNATGIGPATDTGIHINGFSATTNSVVTNLLINGTFFIQLNELGGSSVTDFVYSATGFNTNQAGIIPYFTAQGGSTISNILAVPTNILAGIYRGINPDLIIWHAKDLGEVRNEKGLDTAFLNLYNTLSPYMTNAVWTIVGTFADNVAAGMNQNMMFRRLAKTNNFAYVSCYLPTNVFSYYPLGNPLHPNIQTANWGGAKIEEQLGLRPSGYAEATYPLTRHPLIGGSGQVTVINPTNFLLGTIFINKLARNVRVVGNARCSPTTTGNAQLGLLMDFTGSGFTTTNVGGLEADAIFTTAPHTWTQLTAVIPYGGRWEFYDFTGEGNVMMTNSYYQILQ